MRNKRLSAPSVRSDRSDRSDASDPYGIATASPEIAANTFICLINQASYLLGRQMQTLEQSFLNEGGFTERLYRSRTSRRGQTGGTGQTGQTGGT